MWLCAGVCRYSSGLKEMKLTEDRVAKVVKDRVFSLAFHPCSSSLLVAAGDKWGKLGLWNVVGDFFFPFFTPSDKTPSDWTLCFLCVTVFRVEPGVTTASCSSSLTPAQWDVWLSPGLRPLSCWVSATTGRCAAWTSRRPSLMMWDFVHDEFSSPPCVHVAFSSGFPVYHSSRSAGLRLRNSAHP